MMTPKHVLAESKSVVAGLVGSSLEDERLIIQASLMINTTVV